MTDKLKNMFDNLDIIRDEITKQWHIYNGFFAYQNKRLKAFERIIRLTNVKEWYLKRIIKEINKL